MILFFKHIARTVKSSPYQPLLILVTLIMSVAVGVTAFRLSGVFMDRAVDKGTIDKELGDITVTASSDRDIGILFDTDAKEILGERAEVLGTFDLVALMPSDDGAKIVTASAVDLSDADKYFSFKYYEYGSFTSENIYDSVAISKRFADKIGLSVGDNFSISLLDERLTLTVQAIAENSGLLAERDVLIPMERVLRLLMGRSAFIASLGEDFKPYNKLMINCADGENVDSVARLLSEHDKMQGCIVELTSDTNDEIHFAVFHSITVSLLSFVLFMLALMLMLTSQSLLRKQRQLEYAQFSAVGASGAHLVLMQLLENLAYSFIGASIGILISPFALDYTIGAFGWEQYGRDIGISGIAFGYGISLAFAIAVTFISARKDGKIDLALKLSEAGYPSAPRLGIKPAVISGAICFLGIVISAFIGVRYWKYTIIVSIISFVIFIYAVSPHLYGLIMRWAEGRIDGRSKNFGLLALSVKNVKNNFALRHMGRLLSVVFSLSLAVSVSAYVFSGQYELFDGMIVSEILVDQINAKTGLELKENGSAEGIVEMEYGNLMLNEELSVMAVYVSGDAEACLSDDLFPDDLPGKGEIAVSVGVAKLLGVGIGDELDVNVRGEIKTFTVSSFWNINPSAALIGESFTSPGDRVYAIKLSDGDDAALYSETATFLEARGIGVLENKDVIDIMDTLGGFDALITAVIVMTVGLSSIGLINVITECIGSRRREREILIQSGLEPRRTVIIHILEIGIVLLLALVIGLMCGSAICLMLHYLVHSFGYTMFYF